MFALVHLREGLKLQLESQLRRARAADLIERAQAAVDSAASQTSSKHLRRLSEKVAAQDVHGISEIRVVEEIEEFDFEL